MTRVPTSGLEAAALSQIQELLNRSVCGKVAGLMKVSEGASPGRRVSCLDSDFLRDEQAPPPLSPVSGAQRKLLLHTRLETSKHLWFIGLVV